MLPSEQPDGIQIAFDDHRLVANPESTEGIGAGVDTRADG